MKNNGVIMNRVNAKCESFQLDVDETELDGARD
jgi:hypothetical protein